MSPWMQRRKTRPGVDEKQERRTTDGTAGKKRRGGRKEEGEDRGRGHQGARATGGGRRAPQEVQAIARGQPAPAPGRSLHASPAGLARRRPAWLHRTTKMEPAASAVDPLESRGAENCCGLSCFLQCSGRTTCCRAASVGYLRCVYGARVGLYREQRRHLASVCCAPPRFRNRFPPAARSTVHRPAVSVYTRCYYPPSRVPSGHRQEIRA